MEWYLVLLLIFAGLMILLLLGVPVAIAFMFINVVGVYCFWEGQLGLRQLTLSIYNSVTNFNLLPIPLFILMGDVMFHSGVAPKMMDVLDRWLGRLPGRLSLLAVGGGTLFATMSGSSVAGAAMLGSLLVPEMEKRGYQKPMSLGPILGSGGLALMIPPSALGVLLASIARIPIGDFLVAIIIPGLIMSVLYALYIIIRCLLQPHLAPPYGVKPTPLLERMRLTVYYVLPLGGIIFLTVGLIFMGVATPTESAALGCLGCFVLAFIYKGFDWEMIKQSVSNSTKVAVMIFMILTGSTAFSQILGYTGSAEGLVNVATAFDFPPMGIVAMMQVVLLIMGCFMEPLSILMITIPIFFPILKSLGLDPIWFGVIMLLNMEMANTTPPFGLTLYVMKGYAPVSTTMGDIYRAGLPFLACDAVAMVLIIIFPQLVLWLPSLMR